MTFPTEPNPVATRVTEREARSDGFVHLVNVSALDFDADMLVQPTADLDGRFLAFDIDAGEYLYVNGWCCYVVELQEA